MTDVIYLDNHATTQIDPKVLEAMMPYLTEQYGNAASSHIFGMKAQAALDLAREQVAMAIGANIDEIFFTGGATESNNMTIKGVFDQALQTGNKTPHIITTNVEHKCILEACKYVKARGAEVTFLPVDEQGMVHASDVQKAIKPNTILVSVIHGNNEIGSINPVAEIGELCRREGILFHTDAAQTLGKLPINVRQQNIDLLSASAHKIYGPKGIGFIFIRKEIQPQVTPLLHGGGQESGMRSGTSNVAAIVGFGKAVELAASDMEANYKHDQTLRNTLYNDLVKRLNNVMINGVPLNEHEQNVPFNEAGESLKRLPHNLNIALGDIEVSVLKRRLRSLAFSSGSACSSADLQPSYVLKAIGRSDNEAHSSLRFGIGRFNTSDDIAQAGQVIADAIIALAPHTATTTQ